MSDPTTSAAARTAAATAGKRRAAEQRRADYLRERGWTCTPPGTPDPHPWQEYNADGYSCHYPGCTLASNEHPVDGRI